MKKLSSFKLFAIRSFSKGGSSQIWVLLLVDVFILFLFLILALLLGDSSDECLIETLQQNVYYLLNLLIDPGNITEISDKASGTNPLFSRPGAMIVTVVGMVLFGGLLISVICNFVERQVERYRNGYNTFKLSNHIVIIGYSEVTISLIKTLFNDSKKQFSYILLQTMCPAEEVRRVIYANFDREVEKKIIVKHGQLDIVEDVDSLYIQNAESVYIVGDDNEENHDSANIACVGIVSNIIKNKNCIAKPLPCTVLFENLSTFTPFQVMDVTKEWRESIDFRPMNLCDEWAKRVVVDSFYYGSGGNKVNLPKLDREPITYESEKFVHLVIVGMNKMGIALAVQAAHTLHFPNFVRDKSKKTRITVIDVNVEEEIDFFTGRYSGIFDISTYFADLEERGEAAFTTGKLDNYEYSDFLDIEFHFVKGRIESQYIRGLLDEWATDNNQILSVAVCFGNQSKSLASALYLPDSIYINEIPVFVRQNTSDELLSVLNRKQCDEYVKYSNIYPFGMLSNCYRLNVENFEIAKVVNYAYDCYMKGIDVDRIELNKDIINDSWQNLSQAHKWSNLYHALSWNVKLRSFNIDFRNNIEDKDAVVLSKVEHNRWNMEKLLLGYRTPNKEELEMFAHDESRIAYYKRIYYVHNCIMPYEALANNDKEKDLYLTKVVDKYVRLEQMKN